MNAKELTKFIFFERREVANQYTVIYPSLVFPNKCVACGGPRETVNELALSAGKVVATSYSAPTTTTSTVGVSMKFTIPLCADHKAQIDDHKRREKQEQKKLILAVVGAAVLGSLLMSIIFLGIYHNNGPIAGGIIMSIFFGAPGGVLLLIPAWLYLPALIRVIQKKKPYLYKDPYIAPYNIYFKNDDNPSSMRIMIWIKNDQARNEFKTLNGVEEHLVAAMDYPHTTDRFHSTVCEIAIEALAQGGFETAVPAIINTFIANIHKNDKVCNVAAGALKRLGIPEPLDAKVVEQLMAGMKYSSIRGAVITVLGLSSIQHLIAALDNQDAGVRSAVIYALGQTRNTAAVPALIERLSDTEKNWGTRICDDAARALKSIGTPDALEALEKWKTKTQK